MEILLDAGFVTQRREANRRYYRAVPDALGELRDLVEQEWRARLGELTHRGRPSAEERTNHGHGWKHYLGRLAVVATGGDPGPDQIAVTASAARCRRRAADG